ncbi:unnamed protein product [Rotaria socialis]|uniref:Uncharacterized protein n=1 Tax=Rotaria socialis TaxID=392032 RepID=A0A817Z3P9_9BILA|nr:unnamed protein product [Rotaria socialis]
MPVAIHFLLNPLEGRVDEPPDYLKQNTQLLHFERLQNHEFDSQQMANFSRRLTNVENNLQRVTTDLQGLKDNVLVIMKLSMHDDDDETEENVVLFEMTYASLIACIVAGFFRRLLF